MKARCLKTQVTDTVTAGEEVAAVNGDPGGPPRHGMCSAMRVCNLVRGELPPGSPQGAQKVVVRNVGYN